MLQVQMAGAEHGWCKGCGCKGCQHRLRGAWGANAGVEGTNGTTHGASMGIDGLGGTVDGARGGASVGIDGPGGRSGWSEV